MHMEASRLLTTLNTWIYTPEVLTTLIVAAVSGLVGWLARTYSQRRRFGWNVLYDEQINQGDPSARRGGEQREQLAQDEQSLAPSQNMWEIVYQESGPAAPPYKVTNGSLVVLEMRNIGRQPIRETDFGEERDFTLRFPGRNVVHFKVRDNPRYHERVHRDLATPKPGMGDAFKLPALLVNRGQGFKLLVLLESRNMHPPTVYEKPVIEGNIEGGKFIEYGRHLRRARNALIVGVVLAAVAGVIVGVALANQALTPTPVCASGKLTIEGSTAFAPVFTQVVTEYEQDCPGAQITVRGVGSVQGLQDLERDTGSTPIIAMYDGLPRQAPDPQYVSQAVGDVIFAVVGNRSLPPNLFEVGKDGGMTDSQIAQAFQDPSIGGFVPVGRSSVSGTREAFVKTVLNGDDSSEQNAGSCSSLTGVCLENTTMALLTYVDKTRNAIGYAEADALPFFPGVGAIPINGYEPTRANALNGDYGFLATEHLYTNGIPTGLTEDVINFLTSTPVTAQLRDTSFIACADLSGSKLGGDCARS